MSSLTTEGSRATGTALRDRHLVSRPLADHGAVIDLIDRAPDGHAALAALIAGLEYDCLWRYQRIVEPVQAAKRIAVQSRWPDLLMRISVLEADISRRRGDIVRAATDMQRVNRWAAEHGDDFVLAQTQLEIASIFRSIGDDAECLAHAIQALAHTTESTPIWARVNYLSMTAIALEANKSNVEAYERFDEALELAEADGDADLVVMVLNNMSYCMYMRGENDACIEYADRMREVIAGCAVDLPAHCLDTLAASRDDPGPQRRGRAHPAACPRRSRGGLLTEADALPVCLLTLAEAQRLRGRNRRCRVDADLGALGGRRTWPRPGAHARARGTRAPVRRARRARAGLRRAP